MDLNKKNMTKLAGIVAGAVLLNWALQNPALLFGGVQFLLGLFTPFLAGLAMAFLLNVPMSALERRLFKKPLKKRRLSPGLRRAASLLLAIVLVLAVIFLVLFIVLPEIGNTFNTLKTGLPGFVTKMRGWGDQLAAMLPDVSTQLPQVRLEWDKIGQTVFGFLQNGATSLLNSTVGIATSVFSVIVNFFVGLVFAFYVLFQKEALARQTKKLLYAYLPEAKVDRLIEICALANQTFSRFLTGQCLEACILGLLFFVTMSLFRFPYAMMISVLIGFTALIPIFGAFIGCVVGAFLILVANPIQAVWFLVLFLALQQLEGNLIYPRVVGSSVGLPAMWVMMAVLIGGSTMGIVGMLVMVPLCSVLYVLLRESVNRRLAKKGTPPGKYRPGEGSGSL